MKQWTSLVLAGIFGGLIVLGGFSWIQPKEQIEATNTKVTQVSHNNKLNYSGPAAPNFVEAAEKSIASVVHIRAEESAAMAQQRMNKNKRNRSPFDMFNMEDFFNGRQNPFGQFFQQKGSGSGVIISKDGYIVTNNHVVGFADNIIVTLTDKKEYKATKIGTDPSTDLAVIKIEGENLPAATFGDSDAVRVGEWVLAVGNPFDYLTSTVTAGIVSAKGRDINIIKDKKAIEEFIQTDAAINPGNSGGALVNTKGELIGINTAIATPTGTYAGYSFAIPAKLTKDIVEDIIANGNIERTSLGVSGYTLDEEIRSTYKVKAKEGVYVVEVVPGSAAEFSGLLPNDVIIGLDDKRIQNFKQLSDAMNRTKVGDTIVVRINRKGREKDVRVKLRRSL